MTDLVYKNERSLFTIACVLAALVWLAVIIGTFGTIFLFLLFLFLSYLFIHAGFIAWIKGNGIEVNNEQFPELYTRFNECCAKLNMKETPRLFILNSDGILNAFATKFLRKNYVVLFSSIVDALERKPALIKFYIGHELGHIQRNHLKWGPFLAPVLWLPLLGSAYSRAREYTCDRYGLSCSDSPVDACYALTVLASGERKWAEVKVSSLLKQVDETGGFWMSYHELTNDYPWLTKRLAHIVALGRDQAVDVPKRNPFAYFFAFFTPRSAVPGGGGIFIIIAIIAILASVAIPAYKQYQERELQAQLEQQMQQMPSDYSNENTAPVETIDTENSVASEVGLESTLLALQALSQNYMLTHQSHPSDTPTLEMMNLTQEDLGAAGVYNVEFTESHMTVTLNAVDENTGSNHYVTISPAFEENSNEPYPHCSESSLSAEQLQGICR